jgi:hypothetical protein
MGPNGIPLTKAAVLKLRRELGGEAPLAEVARYIGVNVTRVRNLFTIAERKAFREERAHLRQLRIPGLAAAQVKAMAQVFGKTPSAEQSGVSSKWMDYCGGYNRIVAMAGLVPLKSQPSAIGKVRRGTVCGVAAQRRGHENE